MDVLKFNVNIPNKKLYGKAITVSGWGYTEANQFSDELLFTQQKILKVDHKKSGIPKERGNKIHNFMGDQRRNNGACNMKMISSI